MGTNQQNNLNHVVSFFLGAALPSALLLFLASDRLGAQLSSFSSRGNGTLLLARTQEAPLRSDGSVPIKENDKFNDLAQMLPKIATEDKTVIITSVNEAWARPNSLLDLFRESFRNGEQIEHLLYHTLIVAVDVGAFVHCKAVHPYCYLLEVTTMNVSSENVYMSKGYVELVWTKLSVQQRVLELGYNYLFTDVDIVWFRNPFRHISVYADITTSCDKFFGDHDPLDNELNTGFYYVRPSNRTIKMLKYWQEARARFPSDHDQTIFDKIKHELVAKLDVKIEPLDTAYIGGFCQFNDDARRLCTMHGTCCVGLEKKLHDLRGVLASWKKYAALTPQDKKTGSFKLKGPDTCWK